MKVYSNDFVPKPLKRTISHMVYGWFNICSYIFQRFACRGGVGDCGWIKLTLCCTPGVLRSVPDVRKKGSLFSVQVLIFCWA